MDKETKEALEKSIAHWEDNLKNVIRADTSAIDCALCQKFNNIFTFGEIYEQCNGCPIYEATGQIECRDTPYQQFTGLQEEIIEDFDENNPYHKGSISRKDIDQDDLKTLEKICQEEIDFLKSLRDSK